jgi:hypothetical protein
MSSQTPDIDVAQQIADKVTPLVMAQLKSQRAAIKATLTLPQRVLFPVVFPLLTALVPGIILSSLREAFAVNEAVVRLEPHARIS